MKGLTMVKQFKSPQSYTVLKMSLFECTSIFKGGAGICDNCGIAVLEGYYVPVLNHYLCPKCYQNFTQRTPYYPEDAHFESYLAGLCLKTHKKTRPFPTTNGDRIMLNNQYILMDTKPEIDVVLFCGGGE